MSCDRTGLIADSLDTQGATADHANQAAIDNANMAANLFWHTNEHELPPGVAVTDESKAEDMTPLGVDDGAFDAYVHLSLGYRI